MKLNNYEKDNYNSHSVICFTSCIWQVETKFFPKGDASDQVKPIKDYPKANKTMKLSSFDVQKLLDEDKLNQNNKYMFINKQSS